MNVCKECKYENCTGGCQIEVSFQREGDLFSLDYPKRDKNMKEGFIKEAYKRGYRDGNLARRNLAITPFTKKVIKTKPPKREWEKVYCKNNECGWLHRDKITGLENGHLINCPYDIKS